MTCKGDSGGSNLTGRRYEPRGFVRDDPSRAVRGMQFIWPFKAEYRIIYLDDDYARTIIGRNARDYVWIMAHGPQIGDDEYDAMLRLLDEVGYDVSRVQKVRQSW